MRKHSITECELTCRRDSVVIRREERGNRFSYKFSCTWEGQLPTNVQGDKVEATFDKGVLMITLPKAEEAKKKEIQIKVKQG